MADPVTLHFPGREPIHTDTDRIKQAAARMELDSTAASRRPPREERVGDNSGDDTEVGGIAADRLRSIVERIERLEEERKKLADDVKDIFAEAKSAGFDVKVVRRLLADRKKNPAEVEEQETLLDLYKRALGM